MKRYRWEEEKLSSGEEAEGVYIRNQSLCIFCSNLNEISKDGNGVCKAFPRGIPDIFWSARADHTTPYDGDNGIVFEPYA